MAFEYNPSVTRLGHPDYISYLGTIFSKSVCRSLHGCVPPTQGQQPQCNRKIELYHSSSNDDHQNEYEKQQEVENGRLEVRIVALEKRFNMIQALVMKEKEKNNE